MMRAISSPSSSTTGFATLIFAIAATLASTGRGDHKGRFTRRQADRSLSPPPLKARAGSPKSRVINNTGDGAGEARFAQKMTALLPSIYLKFTK